MIEILCDDTTSCKEPCENYDYYRCRQQQTLNMSVKSMRISLNHPFIVLSCIFSICGSIFSIICTVLGHVSKRSLITSVTTVHGLDNQK